jgi:isochorismate synthase
VSRATERAAALHVAAPPDPADFVATSRTIDPSTWSSAPLAASADGGVLVAGRERLLVATGIAAALPLPRGLEDEDTLVAVRAWLAAVRHATGDAPDGKTPQLGRGPVALGAFAFDRGEPAVLLVPSVTWCREGDGRTWTVEVARRGASSDQSGEAARRGAAFGALFGPLDGVAPATPVLREPAPEPSMSGQPALEQIPSAGAYADAVEKAVADIRAGRLRKVVLGRAVEVGLPTPATPSRLLDALWGGDPAFSPFSVPTPNGRLVGASPELVVSRRGRSLTSHAFAGTVALSETESDADADRLFGSEKDRVEHRLVVEQVVEALEGRGVRVTVPAEPTVVRLRSDARLGTLIRGSLTGVPSPRDTALSLLALLHPTPAVGGVPRAAALERIAELEALPRGYWAGAVGWTDASGDGEWVLAIRSVELDGRRAIVRAGAGIVEGSDPQAELAETSVKLRPVLDALWPGAAGLL